MVKVTVDDIKNYLIRLYDYSKFYDNTWDNHQSKPRLTYNIEYGHNWWSEFECFNISNQDIIKEEKSKIH